MDKAFLIMETGGDYSEPLPKRIFLNKEKALKNLEKRTNILEKREQGACMVEIPIYK